jgi:hypothetical protein
MKLTRKYSNRSTGKRIKMASVAFVTSLILTNSIWMHQADAATTVYIDYATGSDANTGASPKTAVKSYTRAKELAGDKGEIVDMSKKDAKKQQEEVFQELAAGPKKNTDTPEGVKVPEMTPVPAATATPEITPVPEITATPEVTPTPEATVTPEVTPAPEVTVAPEVTPAPEVTVAPEATPAPGVTVTPGDTPAPEATQAPEAEKPPVETNIPGDVSDSKGTEKADQDAHESQEETDKEQSDTVPSNAEQVAVILKELKVTVADPSEVQKVNRAADAFEALNDKERESVSSDLVSRLRKAQLASSNLTRSSYVSTKPKAAGNVIVGDVDKIYDDAEKSGTDNNSSSNKSGSSNNTSGKSSSASGKTTYSTAKKANSVKTNDPSQAGTLAGMGLAACATMGGLIFRKKKEKK